MKIKFAIIIFLLVLFAACIKRTTSPRHSSPDKLMEIYLTASYVPASGIDSATAI